MSYEKKKKKKEKIASVVVEKRKRLRKPFRARMQLACEGFSFFQIANEDKLHSLPVSIAESFVINRTNKERERQKKKKKKKKKSFEERKSNYID